MTCLSSAAEMKPLPSLSNTLNASRTSSSESVSFILRAIMAASGKFAPQVEVRTKERGGRGAIRIMRDGVLNQVRTEHAR